MATEVRVFTLTIPAGTTPAAPTVLDVSFPPRQVDAIQVVVPAGQSGLVGWCVMNSNLRVIPYQSDDWIVTSGESITWPLEGQIDSGSWQVAGYNSGALDHSVYFRFLLSPIPADTPQPGADLIDHDLISATVGTVDLGGTEGTG